MDLKSYLTEDNVLVCDATSKAELLGELSALLAGSLGIKTDELLDAVLRREKLMSTGVGNGLAVPHVRIDGIKRSSLAVAVCKQGVADYESMDKQPVYIVVLIAAPQGQHETYIRLLAAVADVLKDDETRQFVLDAETPAEVYGILLESKES